MKQFNGTIVCIYLGVLFLYFLSGQSLWAQDSSSDASATGVSKHFNPAISINTLFYGMHSSEDEPLWQETGLASGFHLQELCLEMTANVDIYLKALVALSSEDGNEVEVEEAYVTTLQLPWSTTIRGGKMFNTFGRHNLQHSHHMAFAESPLILEQVFGPQLHEVSLEASYLFPLSWYMDLTAGFLNGDNPQLFNSSEKNDFGYLLHLDNLLELSDELTFRCGGSYLTGKRDSDDGEFDDDNLISSVWGLDIHLKWKPLQFGRYRSLSLQGEYVEADISGDDFETDPLRGFFTQLLWQCGLKWWIQGRYGMFEQPHELNDYFLPLSYESENDAESFCGERYSFAVAYVPTEFSAYRLQYNAYHFEDDLEHQFVIQCNITIGSHPAHTY